MQMRPQIRIASAIKPMTDVIIPAIDSSNPRAIVQSQQMISNLGILSLTAIESPLPFRFDRDELTRLSACAGQVGSLAVFNSAAVEAMAELTSIETLL